MAGDIDGVGPQLGGGDVGGLAVDQDAELIHRRVVQPRGEAHCAGGDFMGGVQPKDPLHPFQSARLDKVKCAKPHLFSGLKDQPDLAAEVFPLLSQQPGRAQQAGGVGVVAAGVHDPVGLGAVGDLVQLLDGQCVDIGPQPYCVSAGPCAAKNAQHPGSPHPPVRDLPSVQLGLDPLGGVMLLHGQFRVGMQLPAAGGQLLAQGLGAGV